MGKLQEQKVVAEEFIIPAAQNAAKLRAMEVPDEMAATFPALDVALAVDGHIEGQVDAKTGDILVTKVRRWSLR